MEEAISTGIVIDDDPAIRELIGSLLRSDGLQAKLLASVDEFLKTDRPDGPACLVLDVRLPGRSGLDFQRELAAGNIELRSDEIESGREKCDGEEDAISVQDSDLGVSAGDRQRIFERFRGARFDLRLLTA